MIKRIELINFMSHKHTVIEPADGLTVLVGPNNCGKSAVMSALQILCHNDTSTYVTRHGEKECSIIVETLEGDVIEWTRNRTSTKYVINGETFDRLRGNIPPALLDVLKLPKVQLDQSKDEFDIHFGSQKDPVFLINESGRAAAGFFAASSDASRLLEMQKLHSQNVKESSRDAKRLSEEADELNEVIDRLQFVPELKSQFDDCNQLVNSIELHEHAIDELKSIKKQYSDIDSNIKSLTIQKLALQDLYDPPAIQRINPLSKLIDDIKKLTAQLNRFRCKSQALGELNPPPHLAKTGKLTSLIGELKLHSDKSSLATKKANILNQTAPPPIQADQLPLQELISEIQSCAQSIDNFQNEVSKLSELSLLLENQLEEFVSQNPNCPTCHQPLSKQHLTRETSGDSCDR